MLDLKFIKENKELIKENVINRLSSVDIDRLLELSDQKDNLLKEIESLRAKRNKVSKTKPDAQEIEEMRQIGEEISAHEGRLMPIEEEVNLLLFAVPNLTHPEVLLSQDEDEKNIMEEGRPKKFNFKPKDHVRLAEDLELIDFERGTKVSGNKFYYLTNEAVLLEQALILYAMEIGMKHGFSPIMPPDLVKRDIISKMGYNPRGESTQIYSIENSDLSLIGTAEIPLGGYHKDELLKKSNLPKKYIAVSHCFRTEAGSYSKYTKGIFRVHQFTKVEMFVYCTKEEADKYFTEILEIEKEIFSGLDVPFRVIDHSSADLSAPSYRTFDLEAWMPGKPNREGVLGDWAEVTSVSNCTDYQSRALNIKYEEGDGAKHYAYMLNGTAIALSRGLIALLENNQREDGSIQIPSSLHRYLPFQEIKK